MRRYALHVGWLPSQSISSLVYTNNIWQLETNPSRPSCPELSRNTHKTKHTMARSFEKSHVPESSDTDGVQKSVEEVADETKLERQNAVLGDAEKLVLTGPEVALEPPAPALEPPYSVFTHWQKVGITLMVSFFALISPLSGQIYLPALTQLSDDLGVTISLINLTITTYMVCFWFCHCAIQLY